jgi:surface polysaccharide O-acyltransferase-like enzyme
MKTFSLSQSVILLFFLIGYLLLTGYLRDQVVTQSAKLWISLGSTSILALSVVVSLYLKEKQMQMPDYKKYFYATFFIFLFILIAVILRK